MGSKQSAAATHATEFKKYVGPGSYKEEESKPSFIGSLIQDTFIRPDIWSVFTTINLIVIYGALIFLIAGTRFSFWHGLAYPVLIWLALTLRRKKREKERKITAHRIPFFADSLANALAVGGTLEQAFEQSVYYLKGDFKEDFQIVMSKSSLGQDIGKLLKELDEKYPKTGLRYLISLLEEYRDLGIGISPLLKKIAEGLKVKEEAEDKIHTILAGGSSYAKISIGIFALSFLSFGFLLKDQVQALTGPTLKPFFIFFSSWAALGMVIVTRITSVDFTSHAALKPYVKPFMDKKQWTIDALLDYCGLEANIKFWRRVALFIPLLTGVAAAYASSWHTQDVIYIELIFFAGILGTRFCIEFFLKGLVEDQLIKIVETFPDFMQIFVIGLNSGLNTFKAFEFAQTSIEKLAPGLMNKELNRVKSAILYGEPPSQAWQRFSDRLPFEIVTDFSEIMIISPLHGESIIKSIVQMMNSYQSKRLNLVEKKATQLGQMVIPIIVIAFFPLFLFAVFGPLWIKISALFNR